MGAATSCGGSKRSAVADEADAKDGRALQFQDSVVMQLSENQLEEFREAFNAFDKDGGGSIDSTEVSATWHRLESHQLRVLSAVLPLLSFAGPAVCRVCCDAPTMLRDRHSERLTAA